MNKFYLTVVLAVMASIASAQGPRRGFQREAFTTQTPMVHDPVMAKEGDTYYIYATGMGIQQLTSKDRTTWTVLPQPVMTVIPGWATDSVPGFSHHVWAPDVIQWHGRWWMAYSCSTFGKNGSAIGLLSTRSLRSNLWKDEGCIVASREKRDNWNAIDPNFVIDDNDQPWLVWGSFWDGIQLARLDSTMHLAQGSAKGRKQDKSPQIKTIARRYDPSYKPTEENPTSKYAGTNAIEAPFIFKHGGYYYLFVSWDYCCRGANSSYRVAVGRSKTVDGPYLDRTGKDMVKGGGTIVLEGDKKEWEAAGHCAAYTFDGQDLFICHGYSATQNGAAMLIQRPISWTADGWPELKLSSAQIKQQDFVKGADVGFLTGQEQRGVKFHDVKGKERECLELLKNDYQLSAIRMRVWVNPLRGECDKHELLAMAKRTKALGMDLMVDFHYADSWADPAKQPIPHAWQGHSYEEMKQDLRLHTLDVLSLLKHNGITPRWVQVGNETANGLLWPMGHIKEHPEQYAGFIRTGYDAVKEVFPEAIVIVHLDRGHLQQLYDWNLDTVLKYGGRFDMIGMSLYPYWARQDHPELHADSIVTDCMRNIRHVSQKYGCDVMIVETGYEVDEQHPEVMEEGRRLLTRVVREARSETNGRCRGVFYWEPQCLPGFYRLGAFDSKATPTAIMDGFIE